MAVTVSTRLDNAELEKDYQSAVRTIRKLEAKIEAMGKARNPLAEQAEKLVERLDAAKKKLADMKAAPTGSFSDDQLKDQEETVKSLQAQWNDAQSAVDRYDKRIKSATESLDAQKNIAGAALRDMANSGIDWGAVKEKAKEAGDHIRNSLTNAFKAGAKAVKNVSQAVSSAASKLNAFGRVANSIGPTLRRLGNLATRVFVFSVITKGLRALRSSLSGYLEVNTGLQSALGKLKGAFLTAFTPIYNVVMPALTALVNGMASAMTTVANFTAALFGQTGKQAQANAKALNAQAKATEKAGGAADDAAKSMASFDEINKLSDNSGAGSSADAAAANFELEMDTTVFDSWGAAFSAFLDNILNKGIPALQSGLTKFTNWVNTFSGKLLQMFTFPGVLEKVKGIGTGIAAAFNEYASKVNWQQIGAALGAGLSLALSLAVSFIYTFDWAGAGAHLAAMVNGLASQINGADLGALLWAGFKIGIETLAGFIMGLDVVALGITAADIVNGFVESAYTTFSGVDWSGIGTQIGTGLFTAIHGINWMGAADALSSVVAGVFDFFQSAITAVDWSTLANDLCLFLVSVDWPAIFSSASGALGSLAGAIASFVGTAIKNAFTGIYDYFAAEVEACGGDIVLGILKGIWNVIAGIGTWIWDNIFTPFINGFKDAFDIHSPSTVMAEQGGFIMQGLLGGLTAGLGPILEIFSGLLSNVKKALGGITSFIGGVFTGNWTRAWEGLSTAFTGVWNGIIGTLEGMVNLIIKGLNLLISGFNKLSWKVPNWVPVIGGKSVGFNLPSIKEISIPRLAQGAVIPPNREFTAVLGDQKNGNNLEAPEALLRQIVREESGGSVGGRGEFTIIVKPMAGFTRYMSYELDAESKRRGVNLVQGAY